MDPEFRERLSKLETMIDGQSESLADIKTTLQELVRYSIQNEDNRQRIKQNEDDIDQLGGTLENLQGDIERRWWVLVTLTTAAVTVATLAANWIL